MEVTNLQRKVIEISLKIQCIAASRELSGLRAYYEWIIHDNNYTKGLRVPLMIVIDYRYFFSLWEISQKIRGYRLVASSALPINGHKSLQYGSSNAGISIHKDNEKLNHLMKEAGIYIGMKPHIGLKFPRIFIEI